MKARRTCTPEELDKLIESAPTMDIRNALMELRGLRAVHLLCEPALYKKDGLTYVIHDREEWCDHGNLLGR